MNITRLSQRIKLAREMAKLSQVELAEAVGISDKSVSAYEKGRAAPPLAKLQKLAAVTGQTLQYFTEENIDDAVIATKLKNVEDELAEIKKLLNKKL